MKKSDILQQFINNSIIHGEGQRESNSKKSNKAYELICKSYEEIKKQEESGLQSLLELLEHPNQSVRLWSAKYLLNYSPKAKQVLEELASLDENKFREYETIGFNAEMTLLEWEQGNLTF